MREVGEVEGGRWERWMEGDERDGWRGVGEVD